MFHLLSWEQNLFGPHSLARFFRECLPKCEHLISLAVTIPSIDALRFASWLPAKDKQSLQRSDSRYPDSLGGLLGAMLQVCHSFNDCLP